MAARDTSNALRTLANASRGVASNLDHLDAQEHMLETARDVMEKSMELMQEAKSVMRNPDNPDNKHRLALVAKDVSSALNDCISCLPGQRDVDEALKSISDSSKRLLARQVMSHHHDFITMTTILLVST